MDSSDNNYNSDDQNNNGNNNKRDKDKQSSPEPKQKKNNNKKRKRLLFDNTFDNTNEINSSNSATQTSAQISSTSLELGSSSIVTPPSTPQRQTRANIFAIASNSIATTPPSATQQARTNISAIESSTTPPATPLNNTDRHSQDTELLRAPRRTIGANQFQNPQSESWQRDIFRNYVDNQETLQAVQERLRVGQENLPVRNNTSTPSLMESNSSHNQITPQRNPRYNRRFRRNDLFMMHRNFVLGQQPVVPNNTRRPLLGEYLAGIIQQRQQNNNPR